MNPTTYASQIVQDRGQARINGSMMIPAMFPFLPYVNISKYAFLLSCLAKQKTVKARRQWLALTMEYRIDFMMSRRGA
jgi:hypothetical protein